VTEIRQIQIRRDTSANWVSANPILDSGELGLNEDNGRVKVGDGTSAWNTLLYLEDNELSALRSEYGDYSNFVTELLAALV
jgi:hypothetical protein